MVVQQDYGKHFIAAEVSDEFLDFSASQGNDLRGGISQPDGTVANLSGGCKWYADAYFHNTLRGSCYRY